MDANKIKKLENLHVGFWLLKDTSWCRDWKTIGLIICVPTLLLSIRIAWESRHEFADLIHNIAVCLWISANIVWMIGEFFFNDGTRDYAQGFFYAGLTLVGWFYLYSGWKHYIRPAMVASLEAKG